MNGQEQRQAWAYEAAQRATDARLRRQRVARALWPYAAIFAALGLLWAVSALATLWTGVPG